MDNLETLTDDELSKMNIVKKYFLFIGEQFKESKKRNHQYKGYYVSNCFRVLVGMEAHRTAPGNILEHSYFYHLDE